LTTKGTLRLSSSGWKAEYSVLTLAILLAVVYAYGQSNLPFIADFSGAITPFEAFAAFATATILYSAHRSEKGGGLPRAYAAYSLGMLFWLIAECTWTVYALVFRIEIPFPSMADVFWLLGYLPLLAALLLQAWPFRDVFAPWKRVAIAVGMLVMTITILTATIPPLIAENAGEVPLAVSVAYPVLDALLLSVAIPVLILFRKGSYWRPTLFILFGLMLQLFGDLAFAQSYLSGFYYVGSPIDLIFDYSYLMLALGFYNGLKPNLS
jgi:hypothetical protein